MIGLSDLAVSVCGPFPRKDHPFHSVEKAWPGKRWDHLPVQDPAQDYDLILQGFHGRSRSLVTGLLNGLVDSGVIRGKQQQQQQQQEEEENKITRINTQTSTNTSKPTMGPFGNH